MQNLVKLAFAATALAIVAGMTGHLAWVAHRAYTAPAAVAEANRKYMTDTYRFGGKHWHGEHADLFNRNPLERENLTMVFKLWKGDH